MIKAFNYNNTEMAIISKITDRFLNERHTGKPAPEGITDNIRRWFIYNDTSGLLPLVYCNDDLEQDIKLESVLYKPSHIFFLNYTDIIEVINILSEEQLIYVILQEPKVLDWLKEAHIKDEYRSEEFNIYIKIKAGLYTKA